MKPFLNLYLHNFKSVLIVIMKKLHMLDMLKWHNWTNVIVFLIVCSKNSIKEKPNANWIDGNIFHETKTILGKFLLNNKFVLMIVSFI